MMQCSLYLILEEEYFQNLITPRDILRDDTRMLHRRKRLSKHRICRSPARAALSALVEVAEDTENIEFTDVTKRTTRSSSRMETTCKWRQRKFNSRSVRLKSSTRKMRGGFIRTLIVRAFHGTRHRWSLPKYYTMPSNQI